MLSILILDEPEQGSDADVGYKIIGNIMSKFPDVTIIVISHLEQIQDKYHWDQWFNVEDGVVSRVDV